MVLNILLSNIVKVKIMQSKDIALELLEEEWEKRRKKIIETRKIEAEDAVILSIIRLNHEIKEIMNKMATKDDIKTLKWFISIGFTIIGILIAIIGILK
jgi:hypothetical protein